MATFVRPILLEDAFFFLNQAKSFSTTPKAAWARTRCIRVAILFGWQAIEYSVKDVLRNSPVKLPNKFSSRLLLALKDRNNEKIFDKAQFLRFSKLRNDVAHLNTGVPYPSLEDATQMFEYCKMICTGLLRSSEILAIEIHSF